jgi:hypothetical protein
MIDKLCICGHTKRWHTIYKCMRCSHDKCMHRFEELEVMPKEYSEAIYDS